MQLPPTEVPDQPAHFAQRSTQNLGSAIESDVVTVALADLLLPPGTVVSEKTEAVDTYGVVGSAGSVWRVEGRPAKRPGYLAAAARWISDMQEG